MTEPLHADYDDGYFDKDEQGWCARCVEVRTEGERVTIRRHGDDNGVRAYDETEVGTIGRAWPELGLVEVVGERGRLGYFDTRTKRVRSGGEQILHNFLAPAGVEEAEFFRVGREIVASVAEALGMRPGPPPTQIEMPPAVPGRYAGSGLESALTLPGEHGCRWVFLRRVYPGEPMGPHLDVRVEGDGGWASLFLGDEQRASLLFIGPLECHHLALAARERALAGWCV